jgi:hypothetical protein
VGGCLSGDRKERKEGKNAVDNVLPESALFQAAFEAYLNYITADEETPQKETEALELGARRAYAALERAEGAAAGERLQRELQLWLEAEQRKTKIIEEERELLEPIMLGHPDMTVDEAIKIFKERGGTEQ